VCYSVVNFIFFGQLLQVNEVLKYVGYNKQQDYQSTLDESRGFVKGFVLVVLVPLVPGYYFSAFTIDMLGHRSLQWLGFVLTAGFLAACSGSHDFLLNPNFANDNGGLREYWITSKGGWLFLYAMTFFFMSWGPLTTIFVITAESFPTKWRATGYGICNACGNIAGIFGLK
jgi:PHS family inorganic phosphate transporter-like MFS transporter